MLSGRAGLEYMYLSFDDRVENGQVPLPAPSVWGGEAQYDSDIYSVLLHISAIAHYILNWCSKANYNLADLYSRFPCHGLVTMSLRGEGDPISTDITSRGGPLLILRAVEARYAETVGVGHGTHSRL